MSKVKIVSSATSDLFSDQRVHRICKSLREMGFDVKAVGRKKPDSPDLDKREYEADRLKMTFHKGPLFYAEYNIRLFFYLRKSGADLLISNDLDSLPANALASKLLKCPLVYDSHEYFTEVPELQARPFVRRVWRILEKRFIKRVNRAITVSDPIGKAYFDKYGIEFCVVRNLPEKVKNEMDSNVEKLKSNDERIILYQGSVNMDRGLEEMISSMKYLENTKLVIIGDGDVLSDLREKVQKENLESKVHFTGRIPFSKLSAYTRQADIGISIEKKNGLSYTYALPNKVFDYLQSGIPVVMSDLPELVRLNKEFEFGLELTSHDAEYMAKEIKDLLDNEPRLNELKSGVKRAAEKLNWENESEKIKRIFSDFLDPVE